MNGGEVDKHWFAMSADEVVKAFDSSDAGLTSAAAAERLKRYGLNKLVEEKQISAWIILFRQLRGFFNIVLYVAFIIAAATEQWTDACFIAAILVINTSLSFYQEYKASRVMEALKNYIIEKVVVFRDGRALELEVSQLVPGDVISIEEGMKVPADGRLVEEHALSVEESMLTGESVPSDKELAAIPADAELGDRNNMVFAGTTVVRGTGRAVITATAMDTELGKVAQALHETKTPPTPFELEVDKLSKQITMVIVVMVVAVALLLWFKHAMGIADIAIFSLSLGVGAIPESLPVVLSFALAVGAQQMAQRRALARRLAIVESLGSVDTICTDKTGTLTKNEMTVQALFVPGHQPYFVSGEGYDAGNGEIKFRHGKNQRLDLLLSAAVLCNDARKVEKDGKFEYLGDPTEIAMLVVAEKDGLNIADTRAESPRLNEIPFTSDRKMMSTINEIDGKRYVLTKGAPEFVLDKCVRYHIHGQAEPMTKEARKAIEEQLEHFESKALRVLAVAERAINADCAEEKFEDDLAFLGLIGMIDPPRPEVRDSIAQAKTAGIKAVMITGDNIVTAKAIAGQLGIGGNAVSGREIDAMSDEELKATVGDINVVARATPLTKLRILQSLRDTKHFASMTGDGVNDAPALKQADVGVAMGLRGTDAAKEAAGLVLLDDNYATIVAAIQQGRRIFDNIRKFVNYLLTCNVGEVITVLLGALFGLQPLTAIMVLWINILTDVAPAVALGVDPENPGLMKRKPRSHDEPILNRALVWTTVVIGLKKGIENFIVFLIGYYWFTNHNLEYAQTMAFTGIVVYAFVRIAIIRSFDNLSFFTNHWIVFSLILAGVLQVFIIYCPEVNNFFGLERLDWRAWGVMGALAVWSTTTGIWVSKWVESWAGHVIEPPAAETA